MVLFISVRMVLHVDKFMDDVSHDEFIEQYNTEKCYKHNKGSEYLKTFNLKIFRIIFLHFQRL